MRQKHPYKMPAWMEPNDPEVENDQDQAESDSFVNRLAIQRKILKKLVDTPPVQDKNTNAIE